MPLAKEINMLKYILERFLGLIEIAESEAMWFYSLGVDRPHQMFELLSDVKPCWQDWRDILDNISIKP